MSAQNLLFSNLPVSNLGLYDSTTQTLQTINSDSSGNINLNASGSVVANKLYATNLTAYDISVSNNFTTTNMSLTGTLDVANIVNSNSFQGGTGYFSYGCTAGWSALTNLSSPPTTGTTGQIFFCNGYLYFYNSTNSTYYSISATPLSGPPS
jgi:hypothetical protein